MAVVKDGCPGLQLQTLRYNISEATRELCIVPGGDTDDAEDSFSCLAKDYKLNRDELHLSSSRGAREILRRLKLLLQHLTGSELRHFLTHPPAICRR